MEINLSHTIYSTATIPDQELTIFNLTFLKCRVLPTGDFSIPWDFKGSACRSGRGKSLEKTHPLLTALAKK